MSDKMFVRSASLLMVLLLVSGAALGQGTTASMTGTIYDATGAVIPAATVTVTHVATGTSRTLTTDVSGQYTAIGLPLGPYEVRAVATGFASGVRRGVVLNVGDRAVVDVTLQPGAVAQEVEVTSEAPLLETNSPTLADLLDERQVRELPLNGRGFAQLVTLTPGVQSFPGGSGVNTPSNTPLGLTEGGPATVITASGQRPAYNLFLIDGTEQTTGSFSAPSSGGSDTLGLEGIREFKVLSGAFDATYGQVSGAVITTVSRSGTNAFHGGVFEFLRNSELDARNFFDSGNGPPPFKRNQFGGTLGGPIRRDRTFFFGNYEGLRERLNNTLIAFVPTAAARKGILPGQPLISIPPSVQRLLDIAVPPPNGPDLGSGIAQTSFPGSFPKNQDQFMIRFDHQLRSEDSLFVRYSFTSGDSISTINLPAFSLKTKNRDQLLTIGETHIFSPRLVNQITFSFTRSRQDILPGTSFPLTPSDFAIASRPFFPALTIGGATSTTFTGLTPIGPGAFASNKVALTIPGVQDIMTFTPGRHTLSVGAEVKRYNENIDLTTFQNTSFSFPSLAGFLQGKPSAAFIIPSGSTSELGLRQTYTAFFVQDNFRVRSGLNLNLGLRGEVVTGPSDVRDRISSTDFRKISPPRVGSLSGNQFTLSPRIGLAWSPIAKTVIRAGAGIYYNQNLPTNYAPFVETWHFPAFTPQLLIAPPFPNLPDNAIVPAPDPTRFFIQFDHNFYTPTSVVYTLSLQRELFANTAVTISYAGSTNSHGLEGVKANSRKPVGFFGDNQPIFAPGQPRISPFTGETLGVRSDSNSNYNALLLSSESRFSHGFQFNGNYTFSKTLSDFDLVLPSEQFGQGTQLNPFNRKQDYGRARFDVQQRVNFRGIWELPFGKGRRFAANASGVLGVLADAWEVSAIFTARSGLPVTPIFNFNNSLDGSIIFQAERPNFAPGISSVPVPGTPTKFFDPSVFVLPPRGTFGNAGRSIIDGPGLASLDIALNKTFKLHEQHAMDFRWEVFNVLNRTSFGPPANNVLLAGGIPNPTAGRITNTATTARQMQFSLKYHF